MLPSIKSLRTVFGDNAPEARQILEASRSWLEYLPACEARIRECYHPPSTMELRMTALENLINAHGIEGAQASNGQWLTWLNTGDTYSATITHWASRYRVESWGDRVEILERRRITF